MAKKAKSKGGKGRKLSTAAKAKLSSKAKNRWKNLPAAEKKRRLAAMARGRKKASGGKSKAKKKAKKK